MRPPNHTVRPAAAYAHTQLTSKSVTSTSTSHWLWRTRQGPTLRLFSSNLLTLIDPPFGLSNAGIDGIKDPELHAQCYIGVLA